MIFYHTTTLKEATAIMAEGFRDGSGDYGVIGVELHGVWLSDTPLGVNEGAAGDAVLRIDLPLVGDQLTAYEVVAETPPGYREFVIPVCVVNDRSTEVVIIDVGDQGPAWSIHD